MLDNVMVFFSPDLNVFGDTWLIISTTSVCVGLFCISKHFIQMEHFTQQTFMLDQQFYIVKGRINILWNVRTDDIKAPDDEQMNVYETKLTLKDSYYAIHYVCFFFLF